MKGSHGITVQTFFNEALSFYGDVTVFEEDGHKWVKKTGIRSYFPPRRVSVNGDEITFYGKKGEQLCVFQVDVLRELSKVIGFVSSMRFASKFLQDTIWRNYTAENERINDLMERLITKK